MVVRVFALCDDPLLNKPRQLATNGGARADIQQIEAFQGERFSDFLRISNLHYDIKIEDGLKERQLELLELPNLSQSGEQFHFYCTGPRSRVFHSGGHMTSFARTIRVLFGTRSETLCFRLSPTAVSPGS